MVSNPGSSLDGATGAHQKRRGHTTMRSTSPRLHPALLTIGSQIRNPQGASHFVLHFSRRRGSWCSSMRCRPWAAASPRSSSAITPSRSASCPMSRRVCARWCCGTEGHPAHRWLRGSSCRRPRAWSFV